MMLSEMFLMFLRESKTSYIFMLQIFITPSDCDAVRLTFENIKKVSKCYSNQNGKQPMKRRIWNSCLCRDLLCNLFRSDSVRSFKLSRLPLKMKREYEIDIYFAFYTDIATGRRSERCKIMSSWCQWESVNSQNVTIIMPQHYIIWQNQMTFDFLWGENV